MSLRTSTMVPVPAGRRRTAAGSAVLRTADIEHLEDRDEHGAGIHYKPLARSFEGRACAGWLKRLARQCSGALLA